MISLFKWFFSTSGIQYTNIEPFRLRVAGLTLLHLNPMPGVRYAPKGPDIGEMASWMKWGKYLKEYRCKMCGAKVWSWKRVRVCGRFSCFHRNGSKWR